MTQPSKGVSLSGVSLFGKVPSLTSCFYNNPYMFSIARVFAVANIDIAVHTSQVTAKVRNRCLTISMKLQGNYGRACVCVCVFTLSPTQLRFWKTILSFFNTQSADLQPFISGLVPQLEDPIVWKARKLQAVLLSYLKASIADFETDLEFRNKKKQI